MYEQNLGAFQTSVILDQFISYEVISGYFDPIKRHLNDMPPPWSSDSKQNIYWIFEMRRHCTKLSVEGESYDASQYGKMGLRHL